MADETTWIQAGAAATLIWYDAVTEAGPGRVYQVAGPVLEVTPDSPYFILAPQERGEFASRLYASKVSLAELSDFLTSCRVAEGRLDTECEFVVARRETSLLPLLDHWARRPSGEPLSFRPDINAFLLLDEVALFVTPESHTAVQEEPERFAIAWVCEECGEAEDQSVFLWTLHDTRAIQVRLAIQNTAGVWTCRLHPFQIRKEMQ